LLSEPDPVYLNAEVQDVICNAESNGSINLNPTGGTPDYVYSMDSITWTNDPFFDGLSNGQYPIYFLDSNSCFKDSLITIEQPDSLEIEISVASQITCAGASNGELLVEVNGGIYPYKANIQDDTLSGNDFQFVDLSTGNQLIYVTDSNACAKEAFFFLDEPDSLVAEIAPVELLCFGDNNGIGVVNAAGGFGTFNYQWDNLTQDQDHITLPNLIAGITYSVIISDTVDANCFIVKQVEPTQPPPILFDIFPMSESCDSTDIGALVMVNSGGVTPFQYAVNDGQPVDSAYFYGLSKATTKFTVIDATFCVFEEYAVPYNPNLTEAFSKWSGWIYPLPILLQAFSI
jgi:hypothetical protein